MKQQLQAIEAPELPLRACSVAEHCLALQASRRLPFWWYMGTSRWLGNFSVPFQGYYGNWWYEVKPGLCWPADCFKQIAPRMGRPPVRHSYLGFQHVVPSAADANSHLVINAITDLAAYGEVAIDAKRRNAIRKGFRSCTLEVLTRYDARTFDECRAAWDELTQRTGWRRPADPERFNTAWRELLTCPGVTIIVGRAADSGQVAGFLVTKVIGDTAYVDTIASRTELLKYNVNDALMYAFLISAQRLGGINKAHYAIRSYAEKLESFKRALGFQPIAFPTLTVLRGLTGFILKHFFRDKYDRMHGRFEEHPATPAATPQSAPADAPATPQPGGGEDSGTAQPPASETPQSV